MYNGVRIKTFRTIRTFKHFQVRLKKKKAKNASLKRFVFKNHVYSFKVHVRGTHYGSDSIKMPRPN